jgi:hypothetical protein
MQPQPNREMLRNFKVMQRHDNGFALGVPSFNNAKQIVLAVIVERCERLIQQDHIAVLYHQARKQSALDLPARKVAQCSVCVGG